MKKSRFKDEQIMGFLRLVGGGVPVKDLCRKQCFSDATCYKWRNRLGSLDVSEARRQAVTAIIERLRSMPPHGVLGSATEISRPMRA